MSRTRVILLAIAGVVVTALSAPPASAAPPVRVPAEFAPIEFAAGEVCGFPLRLEATVNKQTITTFSDGRILITGAFRARATNLSTGESVELNTPGPLHIRPNPNGTLSVRGTGPTVFFFFPGDLGPGEPGALLYVRGQLRETVNAEFTAVVGPVTIRGRVQNICDTLDE